MHDNEDSSGNATLPSLEGDDSTTDEVHVEFQPTQMKANTSAKVDAPKTELFPGAAFSAHIRQAMVKMYPSAFAGKQPDSPLKFVVNPGLMEHRVGLAKEWQNPFAPHESIDTNVDGREKGSTTDAKSEEKKPESPLTTSEPTSSAASTSNIPSHIADPIARALAYKNRANNLLAQGQFASAIEEYTLAINLAQEIDLPHETIAVFYANRSCAHCKFANYGSAIWDAGKAIELNPDYSKGYFRRGTALRLVWRLQEALAGKKQKCYIRTLSPY